MKIGHSVYENDQLSKVLRTNSDVVEWYTQDDNPKGRTFYGVNSMQCSPT